MKSDRQLKIRNQYLAVLIAVSLSSTAYSQDINYTSTTGNEYLSGVNGVVTLYQDPGTVVVNTYTDVGAINNSGILNGAILLNNTPINSIVNNTGARLIGSTPIFLGDGSGTLGTGSLVTSIYNYGSIGGSSSTDYGIDLKAPDSKITTLNNYSGGTIQGGTGIQNAGTITTISNAGTIKTYAAGAGAIVNTGSIGSISNSGIINATSAASGNAINNSASGTITSITNLSSGSISVSNGTSVTLPAIYNAGTISTISNFGAINAFTNTRPGIQNIGTISTLNNSQGDNFTANNWLTYKGVLPTNYNIIINSTASYGQLFGTGGITGTTAFGIYSAQNISTSSVYRGVFINTAASNISTSTRSGIYDGYTWSLFQETSGGTLWNLTFSGVSASQTQAALVETSAALQNVFASQESALAIGLTYDCSLFDKNGICISAGGRYTAVDPSGLNLTGAMLIGAYRPNQNSRYGGWIDQNLSASNPGGTVQMGNSTPMVGLFAVWHENENGIGLKGKLSAALGSKNLNITRPIVSSSQAGAGSTNLNTQGIQALVEYGFGVASKATISPYLGLRYSQNNMGGYTESTSTAVTVPLTYQTLNTNTTTALAGLGGSYGLSPQATVFVSAGVETDMSTTNGSYSASGVVGLTPINFNANPVKTRPTAMLGTYYDIEKNHRIGVTGIYRQEPYQGVSTTTVMATYTVGL
jgi:hypothetical protein